MNCLCVRVCAFWVYLNFRGTLNLHSTRKWKVFYKICTDCTANDDGSFSIYKNHKHKNRIDERAFKSSRMRIKLISSWANMFALQCLVIDVLFCSVLFCASKCARLGVFVYFIPIVLLIEDQYQFAHYYIKFPFVYSRIKKKRALWTMCERIKK